MHALGRWALITCVVWSIGCRHRHERRGNVGLPDASVTATAVPPALAPIDPAPASLGSLALPLRPPGCPYTLPAVTPGHPRIVPHSDRFGHDSAPRNLHLTFVGDPSTTVVVQWSTGIHTLSSEVIVSPVGSTEERTVLGYSFTYGGAGQRREHEVHVCGLEPGRRYRYRAGGSGGWLGPFEFATAPEGPGDIRVLVAGDSRTDPATWGRIANRALTEHADVMLFTGDAVVDGASQAVWDAFFAAGQSLLATTPSLWVDGNHEGIAEVYFAQFAFPDNGSPHRHEHWYTLGYGPMQVIALNDTTLPPREIVGDERAFLAQTLASVDRARYPWVITFHHQPLYTTSIGHWADQLTRNAWGPLFDQYHVNVDLAGHVHNYESSEPMRAGLVTDDAHGTRYFIFGGAGAPLYRFRERQPWVHATESTHGYAVMDISSTRLEWTAHRLDGSVIERIDVSTGH